MEAIGAGPGNRADSESLPGSMPKLPPGKGILKQKQRSRSQEAARLNQHERRRAGPNHRDRSEVDLLAKALLKEQVQLDTEKRLTKARRRALAIRNDG